MSRLTLRRSFGAPAIPQTWSVVPIDALTSGEEFARGTRIYRYRPERAPYLNAERLAPPDRVASRMMNTKDCVEVQRGPFTPYLPPPRQESAQDVIRALGEMQNIRIDITRYLR